MAPKDLKAAYRSIHQDFFPKNMEISFYDDNSRQTLFYEKVSWTIEGEEKGLRYGENPGQDAALYKMINGNLCLGDVACIGPGQELVSGVELIKSGKHPGKNQPHRRRCGPEHPAIPDGYPSGGDRQAQQPLWCRYFR
jgi:phosphoribosylaminoimidazolecarboxamide formyltransferase/IMP cyclohydrolase